MIALAGCPAEMVVLPAPANLRAVILVSPDVTMTGDADRIKAARASGFDRAMVDDFSQALREAGYGVVRAATSRHDLAARISVGFHSNAALVTMDAVSVALDDPSTGLRILQLEQYNYSVSRVPRETWASAVNKLTNATELSTWAAGRLKTPPEATVVAPNPTLTPPASARRSAWLPEGGKVAVLDFRAFTGRVSPDNLLYFTDLVRGACLGAAPRLEVMTRENLLVLLQSTGKDLSNCEGECEVDTGRRIGADLIVSGDIHELGSLLKLALRLHETRSGRLLMATQASGKSIEELDANAQDAARALFAPLR
jgi:hypothetical protein